MIPPAWNPLSTPEECMLYVPGCLEEAEHAKCATTRYGQVGTPSRTPSETKGFHVQRVQYRLLRGSGTREGSW